jgi:DNA-binding Xre family transcriptional regulator
MKVGDLVKYEPDAAWSDQAYIGIGVIIAELPAEGILNAAVSVLWSSGEFLERVTPRTLEVINESR